MIKKWKILESKEIYSSHFVTLKEEKLERPDGKIVTPYYAIERPDVVYVIALTKNKEIVLVYQYKNGIKELVWELPAGFVDKGESPKEAAKRELLEETGYTGRDITKIGGFNSGAGLSRNTNYFYVVKNVEKTSDQNLDENEEIEVKIFPFQEILNDIKSQSSILPEVQSQLGVLLVEGLDNDLSGPR